MDNTTITMSRPAHMGEDGKLIDFCKGVCCRLCVGGMSVMDIYKEITTTVQNTTGGSYGPHDPPRLDPIKLAEFLHKLTNTS